ncbi:protein unc-13 homolog C-like [Ixodes scapularis]|uniref:protein unc-13 homolog C-like n=1 Tax=Ixodes scapularis TaxID=6945 RepID=UPI001C3873F1|nr:protein unc-13 homolog C-like [Ixodes scapularis]
MLSNPFCFLVQVSEYLPCGGYRSDNRFLVLLPCQPTVKRLINFATSVISWPRNLLVCGDVEANPGPTDRELLFELLAGQSKMNDTVLNVLASQNEINKKMTALTERIDGLERQVTGLNAVTKQIKDIEAGVSGFDAQLSSLHAKVDDLENRSRRNNLIIYGIDESNTETVEDLEEKVKNEVFLQKPGITITGIERCHRLGRKVENKPRPTILKFIDYREKLAILRSSYKLKGTKVSISEDFSIRVREIRKHLWKSAANEKENGAKVKLVYDKLNVDGVLFGWDEGKGSRFKISKTDK